MKDSYNKEIQLLCAVCGDSNFEGSYDKSYVKCKRCGKEHNTDSQFVQL